MSWLGEFLYCLMAVAVVNAKYIVPGARWYDTDGNLISAHGGSITVDQKTGKFWWFGEYMYENQTTIGNGISTYSSEDLVTWTNYGLALAPIDGQPYISPNNSFQQPRVVYNEALEEYVMWWHIDNTTQNQLLQGLAISQNISGPYTFVNATSPPQSNTSEDIGLFTDYKNGKSYALYNTGPGADGGYVFLQEFNQEVTGLQESNLWGYF